MKTCSVSFVCAATVVACFGCGPAQPVEKGPIPPGPYTVLEADNLTNISLRAYGDTSLWYSLLNANPQLCKRPRFDLEVGETLDIPARDKLDKSLPKSVFPDSLPADYIIMPGDSLHFIAQNVYGNRDEWMRIYTANRDKLSEKVKLDTRQLIAGEVLHLPALEEENKESPEPEDEGTGDRGRSEEGTQKALGASQKGSFYLTSYQRSALVRIWRRSASIIGNYRGAVGVASPRRAWGREWDRSVGTRE